MLNHHGKLLAAAGAVTAAAAIAVTGISAASASPRTGPAVSRIEHIQVMSTSTTSRPASAVAYGTFTTAGTARLGSAREGTITFPGGTIRLRHHAGKGTRSFNRQACLTVISQPGTYKIVGGTGKYTGISGHGTYHLSFVFIGARTKGKCSMTSPPVARQELLRLTGPVNP